MKKAVLRKTMMYSTRIMVRIDLLWSRFSEDAPIINIIVTWNMVVESTMMHALSVMKPVKFMKMKSPTKLHVFRIMRIMNR